ncbi:MAG TPA: hypothetical protein VL251_02620 [Thermomonas sp.]|jgi:hypothetical protein|nr:hypothetical protein [Thermomonas sp.]
MNNKQQNTQDSQQANSRNPAHATRQQAGEQGWNQENRQYWQSQYNKEPYYASGRSFDQYEPAYRTGTEARNQYAGQQFSDVEGELRSQYEANRGSSALRWDEGGREACQAAWMRGDQDQTRASGQSQSERTSNPRH